MKITTEDNVKNYILSHIKYVYIGFDDNTEVMLPGVKEYDIDLDKVDYSTIELTNAFGNTEIENHFSKHNRVIYVHIEACAVVLESSEKMIDVFYDIPCDMKIKRLRINNDIDSCNEMFIQLEGAVK